jgi:hypothetical protein
MGLTVPESGIETIQVHQLSMVSPFHDLPLIKYQDFIGVTYRAEAMGNGEYRHRLGNLVQGCEDACFAQAIEGAGGLIQNQKLGLF